jgi:hypothetical protein
MMNFVEIKNAIRLKTLPFIGKGSSRKVYDLENGYVVKVAMNSKGIAQNKTEVNIYEEDINDYYAMDIFANIHSYSEDFKIIIVEKCTKVKNIKMVKQLLDNIDSIEIERNFIDLITEISSRYGLINNDISRPSSWGLNSQNKPVLIDYGLTHDVYYKNYANY